MRPLRIVVVGAGANVWRLHLRGIAAIGAQVVAVHDQDAARANKAAEELACVPAGSLDELLEREADVAVVLAPHPFHAEIAVACLRAGRHVLVEKPIAVTPGEADRMCAEAEASDRQLGVVFQHRTRTEVVRAKRLLQADALGEIHRIDLVASWPRRSAYFQTAPWRGT